MIRFVLLPVSIFVLGGCAVTCSRRFEDVNARMLETAHDLYDARVDGRVSTDQVVQYQHDIERVYALTESGGFLCEGDEGAAFVVFDNALDILGAIDEALVEQPIDRKGG
ncbi:MAG: hypothetical protein ACLFP8_08915 [Alphaproteobacteria bacterium]